MRAFPASNKLFTPTKPLWWMGALLSLGVGMALHTATLNSIENEARERFKNHARNSQYNIASGIKAYTDVLRGTASYFQSVELVTRESFHRYVQGLDVHRNFPAIVNINFAQHVTRAGRAAFEQRPAPHVTAGQDDYPPRLRIKPDSERAEYAVITLLEPMAGYAEKYGVDIGAKPAVAAALAQSRDSGVLCASGQPIDVDSSPGRPALAMRLPVYRPGLPLTTISERRHAYFGSVGIGFSVHRLVQSALEEMPVNSVRLTLREDGPPGGAADRYDEGQLLFDSAVGDVADTRPGDLFLYSLPIDFNGRPWIAHFSAPKAALYSQFDAYLPWLALLTGFTGSMLIYALFQTLSSSRMRAIKMAKAMTKELRDSQTKLQLSHHKLRRLAAHAEQIKEEERKRIAREIHDDLGQNLLALRIEADILTNRTGRHPLLHARARYTVVQIDNTIKSVRQIINDLRPTVLDLGLGAAVEWQIAQFRQRSGIVCELDESAGDAAIDDHCAIAYFRILQESLSNILQHAKASMVRVELRQHGGRLSMIISDNGVGLHKRSRNKTRSFGLVGIEERISILGGECSISGSPNAGTVIAVSVPLASRAPGFSARVYEEEEDLIA